MEYITNKIVLGLSSFRGREIETFYKDIMQDNFSNQYVHFVLCFELLFEIMKNLIVSV